MVDWCRLAAGSQTRVAVQPAPAGNLGSGTTPGRLGLSAGMPPTFGSPRIWQAQRLTTPGRSCVGYDWSRSVVARRFVAETATNDPMRNRPMRKLSMVITRAGPCYGCAVRNSNVHLSPGCSWSGIPLNHWSSSPGLPPAHRVIASGRP